MTLARPLAAYSWRPLWWGAIAALLVAPMIAMQFTREVAWDGSDFAAAALLLVGGAALFELLLRMTSRPGPRIAIGLAILLMVALIWAQGAVGLI